MLHAVEGTHVSIDAVFAVGECGAPPSEPGFAEDEEGR